MSQSGGTTSGNSIWPLDVLRTPKDPTRRAADHLLCFLACPFGPQDKGDELLSVVQSVCGEIGHYIGADIECVRADKISIPGTIHSDIWKHRELADALVFDVTGGNGNVLLELGVAAACRSQDNVVILRDQEDAKIGRFLFDIAPNRHLLYNRSWGGHLEFRRQLKEALVHALTPAPYMPVAEHTTSFPFETDLCQGAESIDLLSPPMIHRRVVKDGLEFGSFYFFRHPWITIGNSDHTRVKLEAEMRFSDLAPNISPAKGWIGIALWSQHFFANYSHLVYVRSDGTVWHTEPLNESQYRDVQIASIDEFNFSQFVTFHLDFGLDVFQIRVNEASKAIQVETAPPYSTCGEDTVSDLSKSSCVEKR